MSFLKRYLFIITLYTALIACAHTRSQQNSINPNLIPRYTEPADVYLEQAESSPEPTKKAYELKAAGRLIQDDMSERASQIIESIEPQELSPPLRNEQLLLQSQLTLREQKPKDTLALLSQISQPRTLSPNELNVYHYLLANAYEDSDDYLESAHHYILLNKINTNQANKKYYQEKIWDNLSRVEDETLIKLSQKNFGSEINGWISLVAIPKRSPDNWQQMQTALSTWKSRFPEHTGNETVNQDQKNIDLLPLPPKQIALLLPLGGELEEPANAIQDGFMGAYYETKKSANLNPDIKIYDTNEKNITQVYQQAVDDGADFIVGPLDKNQAQAIAKPRVISVPTLALNYIPRGKKQIYNFYQFGLSLNDEANQIASKAWQAGYRKAMIIAPESQWGQEVADFFAQRWFSGGGEIVDQLAYAPSQDLNSSIKRLMHIDRSEIRKERISKLIHQDVRFVPRRREDVDFIFLVAYPAAARQINPMLKYYYAGEIPIYAPSIIYSGSPDSIQDSDLDGIIFSEIPWVLTHMLTNDGESQQDYKEYSVGQNPYIRLYALGYDTYQLTYKLNHFILFPDLALKGETGMLDLNNQGLLIRKLAWAQFKNGVPQAI